MQNSKFTHNMAAFPPPIIESTHLQNDFHAFKINSSNFYSIPPQ